MSDKLLRLNLGCGANKIPSYINIDVEKSVNPDRVCDFVKDRLPFKDAVVDEIVLFHTIEHIQKKYHRAILGEIYRVLRPGGVFLLSFPEWERCAKNLMDNYKGMRDFWEATLYGRQLFPSDFHVCVMHTPTLRLLLTESGFTKVDATPEPGQLHNTIIRAIKGIAFKNYETLCEEDMLATRIVNQGPRSGRRKRNANR